MKGQNTLFFFQNRNQILQLDKPSACILPLVYVRTERRTVKGCEMSTTHFTHTFTLEWVQEISAHFAIISRRSRGVVHPPHVVRRILGEKES